MPKLPEQLQRRAHGDIDDVTFEKRLAENFAEMEQALGADAAAGFYAPHFSETFEVRRLRGEWLKEHRDAAVRLPKSGGLGSSSPSCLIIKKAASSH